MTTAMTAAFTLTLQDKLTTGLQRIQKQMETLKSRGTELNLGKLEKADSVLRNLGREIRNVTSDLRAVEGVADRAWAAMKRMASVSLQHIRTGVGNEIGPKGKLGGLSGALGGLAAGYTVLKPVESLAEFRDAALLGAMTRGLQGKAAYAETDRLMKLFNRDALGTGQTSLSMARAYRGMIKGGLTPEEAETLLPVHSRAATAYNIDPEALGNPVAAMRHTLKIDEKDMPGALAAMHTAAQTGRFDVQDFALELPGIAGNMAKLGMTGRANFDRGAASLETIMQYSSTPGQGAADFNDLMNDILSPTAARQFGLHNRGMTASQHKMLEKYHVQGIDLPKLKEDAAKKGIDPITAVLRALHKSLDGLPQFMKADAIGAFVGNSQARNALQALFDHPEQLAALTKILNAADGGKLEGDFKTRHDTPKITLATGGEAAEQIERRAGVGFEPIVTRVVSGLEHVVGGIDALDTKLPGLGDAVFQVTGVLLAGVATLGAVGFAAPAISAGAGLLAPLAVTIAGFAAGVALPIVAVGALLTWINDKYGNETPEQHAEHLRLVRTGHWHPGDPEPDAAPGGAPIHDKAWFLQHHDASAPLELPAPAPSQVELMIRTEPGTEASVIRADRNIRVTTPNPGNTTKRP